VESGVDDSQQASLEIPKPPPQREMRFSALSPELINLNERLGTKSSSYVDFIDPTCPVGEPNSRFRVQVPDSTSRRWGGLMNSRVHTYRDGMVTAEGWRFIAKIFDGLDPDNHWTPSRIFGKDSDDESDTPRFIVILQFKKF
jgi:hypothetical protein